MAIILEQSGFYHDNDGGTSNPKVISVTLPSVANSLLVLYGAAYSSHEWNYILWDSGSITNLSNLRSGEPYLLAGYVLNPTMGSAKNISWNSIYGYPIGAYGYLFFSGVNQSNSLGTIVSDSGTSASPTCASISSMVADYVLGIFSRRQNPSEILTEISGTTTIGNVVSTTATPGYNTRIAVGYTIADTTSETIGYTSGNSNSGNSIGFAIHPSNATVLNLSSSYMNSGSIIQPLTWSSGSSNDNGNYSRIALALNSTPRPAYDSYTQSLLHFGGANGTYIFNDEIGNNWISYYYPNSLNGTSITTSRYKFGTSSAYSEACSTGEWIQTDTDFSFGSQDFTIEMFINSMSSNAELATYYNRGLFGVYQNNDNYWGLFLSGSATDNQAFGYVDYVSAVPSVHWSGQLLPELIDSETEPFIWHHVALVKQNTNIKAYFDGTNYLSGSCNATMSVYSGSEICFTVGKTGRVSHFHGCFDEFRISIGIARWTSNFTPPTSAYEKSIQTTPITSTSFYQQPIMYSNYPWV